MRGLCFLSLVAVGCTAEIVDDSASVAFTSPAPGASFTRDALGETGALVARVPLALEIGGPVASVTITSGDRELGDAISGAFAAEIRSAGTTTITATALGDDGTALATTTLDVTISEPQVADCHGWLDLYKLDYTIAPAKPGIADPITVTTPINGVAYRYSGNAEPRTTLMGDCSLIKSLAAGASIMREHDIATLVDIGVYNYRCIDQSKSPPNCTMSQHAYAKAIDIAAWETTAGEKYTVLTDWNIDPATTTCSAETTPGKDAFLHEVICALKKAGVWNIVLTPNYNADHRNHFHVDLTDGANTIKRELPEGATDDGLVSGEADFRTGDGLAVD
jgi:hypothetical protein